MNIIKTCGKAVIAVMAAVMFAITASADGPVIVDDSVTGYLGELPENLVIPDGVKSIEASAFADSVNLKTLTLPASVTTIKTMAFANCGNLHKVSITTTAKNIATEAFKGCSGLTIVITPGENTEIPEDMLREHTEISSLQISHGVTGTGHEAFYGCVNVHGVTIANTVTNIGHASFAYCDFSSVTIPDSVTEIDQDAFGHCASLASFTIPDSVKSVGSDAFYYTKWYKELPNGIIYKDGWLLGYKGDGSVNVFIDAGTKGIADGAFKNNNALGMVVFSGDEKSIGNGAFEGCGNLVRADLKDGLTDIGECAFANCNKLKQLKIPSTVTRIGRAAFYYCEKLNGMTIPEGVTIIESQTFEGCELITDVNIPAGVTYVFENAFYETGWWNSLTDGIVILDGWVLGVKGMCPDTVEISEGIIGIAESAFRGCIELKNVTIPGSVKHVGEMAFANSGLTNVSFAEGVTSIAGGEFLMCEALTDFNIPDSVTNINMLAFFMTAWWNAQPDGVVMKDGWVLGVKAVKCPESIVLPEGTKGIADAAFYDFKDMLPPDFFPDYSTLKSLTIPDGVKFIGLGAFLSCDNLTEVIIPPDLKDDVKNWGLNDGIQVTVNETPPPPTPTPPPPPPPGTVDSVMQTVTIGDSESTAITETFAGTGTLTFKWKVSSEPGCDVFSVVVDGVECNVISGERNAWEEVTIPFAKPGTHTVKWVYTKDESFARGSDCGSIMDVKWTAGTPAALTTEQIPSKEIPCLDRATYTFETFSGFGFNEQHSVNNLKTKTGVMKRVGSGKLPAGVKLKFDKKNGNVLLSGAPTKAGRYEYVMRIEEKADGVKRVGTDTKFVFDVKDVSKLPASDRNFNASAGKRIKLDLPVFTRAGAYAGILNVNVSNKGAITAKLKGVTKSVIAFKGNWQFVADGNMGAVLTTKKSDARLKIILAKNGNLYASVANAPGGVLKTSEYGAAATSTNYAEYIGGERTITTEDGVHLLIKVGRNGKTAFSSPDNKSLKGTAQLLLNAYEDGSAQLCIVKKIKMRQFVYVIKIK